MGVRSDLLAAIVARMEAVDPVSAAGGTIHNRERYTQQSQVFADAFRGTLDHLQGWWVTFEGSRDLWSESDGSALATPTRVYAWRVYHVTGIDDSESTYTEHQDRAEAFNDDIIARDDLSLSSVVDYSIDAEIGPTEAVALGNYLCWRTYVDVEIRTRRGVTYA